jgi:hypothetical protein
MIGQKIVKNVLDANKRGIISTTGMAISVPPAAQYKK